MFYEYRLTVPANTPADDPLTQEITLAPGRIIAMAVGLPRGCVGLVHAQVWHGLNIHWPSNPDSSISGDAVVVEWQESYDLDPTAPVLRLAAWNLDDSYAHTITFRLNVLAKATIDRMEAAMGALDFLARWYNQHPAST
jgi:hypothetical protein